MGKARSDGTKLEQVWEHAGLKCAVIFVGGRHRCGYVAIPKTHVAYNASSSDVSVSVHGGLTYSNFSKDSGLLPGKEYWLGFDCAHYGDDIKGYGHIWKAKGHFWTLEDVVKETEFLAEQLQKLDGVDVLPDEIREFIKGTSVEKFQAYKRTLGMIR